jgi:hypothetical protein
MYRKSTIYQLGFITGFLSMIVALIGLLYQENLNLPDVINTRGELVSLYGIGIYAYDSIMIGAANRGTDLVVLLFGIPLLIISLLIYKKREEQGLFLLSGTFAYFFYLYATFSLSIAYNRYFIVYIIIFGISFFGVILTLLKLSHILFQKALKTQKTWIPYYLIIMGLIAGILWAVDPITSLLLGTIPKMSIYPTLYTHAFDLAIIVPISILSGIFMRKKHPLGIILSIPVLMIITMLFPGILASTYFQYKAGLTFSPQEIIGFIVSFLILGIFGLISLRQIYRTL